MKSRSAAATALVQGWVESRTGMAVAMIAVPERTPSSEGGLAAWEGTRQSSSEARLKASEPVRSISKTSQSPCAKSSRERSLV